MARQVGMSQTMMSRVWRAFGLAPHRSETSRLSRDPAFVDKVRDGVGFHLNPPDRALILCVDEKPQIQAVEGTAPVLPMRPGQAERHSHDHKRHGTTDLFAALDVRAGMVIGACKGRRRATEFRAFLDQVERRLPQRPRWHLHFIPTSSSWLNLVESWFSLLARRCLQRGAFSSTDALEA